MVITNLFTNDCFLDDFMDVFDAADRYRQNRNPLIILAGKDYGSGYYSDMFN